ncbi:MAG TPA: Spy/CpxP family protein refolding chaperone [Povalibacter sp.]|nr:Spy/CpxP family protein refolding chaperone [Povalibacter sp.]
MNPNRLRNSVLAACAALTLAGGVALANSAADDAGAGQNHSGMHRHGGHRGGAMMSVIRQLDLTAEQKQSIHSIFEGSANQRKAMADLRRANRESLAITMPDDPNYPALIAAQKRLAADAIQHASDLQTQVYAVLTPQQKAQVPQLMAERKARWEERRQRFQQRNKDATAGDTTAS